MRNKRAIESITGPMEALTRGIKKWFETRLWNLEKRRRYIKLFNIAGNVNTNHYEGER